MSDAPENAQTEVESSAGSVGYSVSRSRHRKALIVLACVAVGAVIFDHLTKHWAINTVLARLQNGEGPIEVIGTWVQFTYAENTGAAFSIGTGYTWIFSIVAIIVAIVILRTARNLGSVGWAIALGGLLGGLLGNLIDRFTREPGFGRGYVVDFIAFPNFPVFNVADSFITCSAVLMVVLTLCGIDYRGNNSRNSSVDSSHDGSHDSSRNDDAAPGGAK